MTRARGRLAAASPAGGFALGGFRPHLERFLRHDLMRILSGPARRGRWHLFDRCEWCEFFDHCRDEMRQTDDVSRLVQLTTYGKRHLREEAGVQTLTELGHFLSAPTPTRSSTAAPRWPGNGIGSTARRGPAHRSRNCTAAASPDSAARRTSPCSSPCSASRSGQAIYLAGPVEHARGPRGRLLSWRSPAARASPQPAVWLAERARGGRPPSARPRALRRPVPPAHDYNAPGPSGRPAQSLQAYVHTEQERALLFAVLLEALRRAGPGGTGHDAAVPLPGAGTAARGRSTPDQEVAYPVVVLHNAVSRLLALPVEVSYTLPEMLAALGSRFATSGAITSTSRWATACGRGAARGLVSGRTTTSTRSASSGRSTCSPWRPCCGRCASGAANWSWPPQFTLPAGAGIREPLLSRLAFFARYESLLRCLAIREASRRGPAHPGAPGPGDRAASRTPTARWR